jgi:hypothetical protein
MLERKEPLLRADDIISNDTRDYAVTVWMTFEDEVVLEPGMPACARTLPTWDLCIVRLLRVQLVTGQFARVQHFDKNSFYTQISFIWGIHMGEDKFKSWSLLITLHVNMVNDARHVQ